MTYESKYIDLGGVRLHYLEWQSGGPPALILHGNGHSGGVFAPLGDRLATHFHVLALDLRGHGLSQRTQTYTWPELRQDVAGFIEALDLRDLLFVSHSRGGGLSLLVAAELPERVRGVVAFEPTVPRTASLQSQLPELVQRTLTRRSRFAGREEMYRHFHNRGGMKRWQDDFVRAYVQHASLETEDGGVELANPPQLEALMQETMLDGTEWAHIKDCPVPVLAVYGERNARLREGSDPVATIRQHFPNTRMLIQPDSTHSGIMEHPDVFVATVRAFAAAQIA